jgi:hypothetical protein
VSQLADEVDSRFSVIISQAARVGKVNFVTRLPGESQDAVTDLYVIGGCGSIWCMCIQDNGGRVLRLCSTRRGNRSNNHTILPSSFHAM